MNRSKEKLISFSTDMVRAILDGCKTMTRRPIDQCKEGYWQCSITGEETWHNPIEAWECAWHNKRPKWFVGDFVRVKETDIVLELTAVRVERLQDITEEDAQAEGMPYTIDLQPCQELFATLWDSLYAKRGDGWDANPWVYVIEFRRVK
jgi:hypothetical protein